MGIYVEPVKADFWQLYKEPDGSYLDPLGPKNCMTHTAARLVWRANEGVRPVGIRGVWPPTGYQIRRYTGDFDGGVNHRQIQTVLANYYNTGLLVYYNFDFDTFIDMIEDTRGGGLSVGYGPILESSYRGSFSFNANHEIFIGGVDRDRRVFTGVIDPLADGRQSGLFKGPASYPFSLLREAAGELDTGTGRRVGYGLCYAALTKPTGGAPVVVRPPATNGPALPVGDQIPMNVLDGKAATALLGTTQTRMFLRKGTPFYTKPGGGVVATRASRDMSVVLSGYPGTGWRTVVVSTAYGSPNGAQRIVELYVPKDAGPVS